MTTTANPCPPHHWLFEAPNGAVVQGVCQRCGEKTERATAPEPAWMGQRPGADRHRPAA